MSKQMKIAIFVIDVILFACLLAFLPFDEKVNKGLAILVFVAILWLSEIIHVTVTAILIPILAVLTGLMSVEKSLVSFADSNIFLFFGGFALAATMHYQELDKVIAQRVLRLANGKFALSIFYIFSTTAFLSMWMSNTATAAMMLPLAIGMLSQIDATKERNTYVFVLLGVAYSASIGGIGTLVGTPPNAIVATQLNITFAQWLQYGIPMVVILMPLMIFVLYMTFKPKLDQRFSVDEELIPMDKNKYITLAIFIFIALCWVFSSYISPLFAALFDAKSIKNFDSIIAILAAVLVCASGVIDWKRVQKNTDWGVLLLFGGGITLSIILKDSGASKVMADGIVLLINGKNIFLIALIVGAFIVFLTEFTSNTASAALLVPLFISIADSLGVPALGLALIIAIGASCAFMLPVATPPNAIVYGTGHIKQQEMVKAGIRLNVLCSIIIAIAAYLFWL
ncbi:transporter [Campylobacter sp. MIT 12-8780]|uniref:SLC13 family permease n=1 Tax=unclassified Campylobacter TaxID=2593542 RepID=UPI00115CC568|nr:MULTISPECIES: DASS family sodium-coupled anion symporter [unclassified Campylobacter]NDJ26600.1 DASS family sodium-coupled anion symporter [Campylobacter sp. MIT 19-121]TQR43165.1 transporter [Campylobacter sp. MIT 12-8780]